MPAGVRPMKTRLSGSIRSIRSACLAVAAKPRRRLITFRCRGYRSRMPSLSRRQLLERCAATGVLVGAPMFGRSFVDVLLAAEQAARHPTPSNALGPFYRKGAPHGTMLRQQGDAGMPLQVSGVVYDVTGQVRPDATIEL